MSLHNIAQHMQGAGRGQDSMLVHMTPGEVQGLQKLALAHGGSLTINPKTGLPEAGFLSSLLPMIAGFALGPAGLGMTAMNAGLATAAVGTLATGSLSKGIMAGLGAYGGAGLGGGLLGLGGAAGSAGAAGTTAVGSPVANSMIGQAYGNVAPAVANTMPAAAVNAAQAEGMAGGLSRYAGFGPSTGTPFTSPLTQASSAVAPGQALPFTKPIYSAVPQINPAEIAPPTPVPVAQAPIVKQPVISGSPVMQGFKTATSNGMQGLKDLYGAMEKESPYSGMAAGYSLMNAMNEPPPSPTRKKSLIRPYTLDRQRVVDSDVGPSSSAERQYFNDVYTALTPYEAPGPEYAASGGMMGMAEGGYVDETMNHDAVGLDSGRPLPPQQPIFMGMQPQQPQQNIIAQPGSTMTTPGFAEGGSTLFYNPKTGKVEPKPKGRPKKVVE